MSTLLDAFQSLWSVMKYVWVQPVCYRGVCSMYEYEWMALVRVCIIIAFALATIFRQDKHSQLSVISSL